MFTLGNLMFGSLKEIIDNPKSRVLCNILREQSDTPEQRALREQLKQNNPHHVQPPAYASWYPGQTGKTNGLVELHEPVSEKRYAVRKISKPYLYCDALSDTIPESKCAPQIVSTLIKQGIHCYYYPNGQTSGGKPITRIIVLENDKGLLTKLKKHKAALASGKTNSAARTETVPAKDALIKFLSPYDNFEVEVNEIDTGATPLDASQPPSLATTIHQGLSKIFDPKHYIWVQPDGADYIQGMLFSKDNAKPVDVLLANMKSAMEKHSIQGKIYPEKEEVRIDINEHNAGQLGLISENYHETPAAETAKPGQKNLDAEYKGKLHGKGHAQATTATTSHSLQ